MAGFVELPHHSTANKSICASHDDNSVNIYLTADSFRKDLIAVFARHPKLLENIGFVALIDTSVKQNAT